MSWLFLLLLVPFIPGLASLLFTWFTYKTPGAVVSFLVKSPLSIYVKLLAMVLAPMLAAWSVVAKIDVLPYPFSLFHSDDDTLDGGQHQKGWPEASGLKLWWQRTHWIWRNPAYGFDSNLFGYRTKSATIVDEYKSGSGSWESKDGTNLALYILETAEGKKFFSVRLNWVYSSKKYLKLWLGWNYVQYAEGTYKIKNTINPFKNE